MAKKHSLEALGTTWVVYDYQEQIDDDLWDQLEQLILKFQSDYSRFDNSSLVSKLNHGEVIENPAAELVEMLGYAKKLYQLSSGHFDIRVGKHLEQIGYDSEYSFISKELQPAETQIDLHASENGDAVFSAERHQTSIFSWMTQFNADIQISDAAIQLSPGTKIDFGGFGKGWLIDKVADFLKQHNTPQFLINVGGDIYATNNDGDAIECALEDPRDTSKAIGRIEVANAAIAASAANRRKWVDIESGQEFSHLVNLNDHKSPVVGTFTYAASALAADAAATILYVSPAAICQQIAAELNVEYLILLQSGKTIKSPGYPAILNSAGT